MKNIKQIKQDSGWIEITNFNPGYEAFVSEDYSAPAYRIIDGWCYLNGVILRSNSVIATTNIGFILDAVSTPYYRINIPVTQWTPPGDTTFATAFLRIQNNGQVAIFTTASTNLAISRFISLDSAMYPV